MALQLDPGRWLWAPLIGLLSVAVGLMAGVKPELAIAAAFMVAFVILVLADLIAGLAVFTFLAFLEIVPFGGSVLSFTKVLGLLLVLSWLTLLTAQRGDVALPAGIPRTVIVATVALFGWVALSTAWSEDPLLVFDALSRYVLNGILFVIVLTSVNRRQSMQRMLAAFITGAFVAACYGLAAPSQFEAQYGRLESAALDPNELAAVLVPAVALCMFAAIGLHPAAHRSPSGGGRGPAQRVGGHAHGLARWADRACRHAAARDPARGPLAGVDRRGRGCRGGRGRDLLRRLRRPGSGPAPRGDHPGRPSAYRRDGRRSGPSPGGWPRPTR